jgi:mRNA interferase MazF
MPRAGEIWLAASKLRPLLVLWEDAADVVVAAVTKAVPRPPTDVPLHDWAAEGLVVASTVRLSRLDCLEQVFLRRPLGRISQRDGLLVKTTWSQQVQLQL